jgi:hypothetical protein
MSILKILCFVPLFVIGAVLFLFCLVMQGIERAIALKEGRCWIAAPVVAVACGIALLWLFGCP